jgi:hypothetical protein
VVLNETTRLNMKLEAEIVCNKTREIMLRSSRNTTCTTAHLENSAFGRGFGCISLPFLRDVTLM